MISRYNTPEEMDRKLADYFGAGVRLVWYVYHTPRREVHVMVAPERRTVIGEQETLVGGEVLPQFALPLEELFAEGGQASES